tara:strand:- start:1238 stop:1684 length:447 start_codon:yes stop_codon:yes gene_type:complete
MIKANVILENIIWKKRIKDPNTYIKKRLKTLSRKKYFKKKKQIFSILLTNNQKMKNLNNKFRKKNKPTDVLSFPIYHKMLNNLYIGDIAISYEIINKRSQNSNFFLEFDKIWIHGYLHLLGYKHKKLLDYKIMSKKENLILNYFHKKN